MNEIMGSGTDDGSNNVKDPTKLLEGRKAR